jgi:Intraflagellar transport complex B protein 46 C terminal
MHSYADSLLIPLTPWLALQLMTDLTQCICVCQSLCVHCLCNPTAILIHLLLLLLCHVYCATNKQLPGPELEMSLEEYARTVCAIMDVPVYDNIVESLHLLFTVFQVELAFKHSTHYYYITSCVKYHTVQCKVQCITTTAAALQ